MRRPPSRLPGMSDQDELAVVVFEEACGEWRPSQVFTRKWMRFHSGREGWRYEMFDGSWCDRDAQLHLYNSGGGSNPYVHPYSEAATMPGRIWIADGQTVHDGRKTDGPPLSDETLLAMGYQRIHEHPGDIFDGASDNPTTWCEECGDNIPRYDNSCDHLVTCWHCQANYTTEGDEESRCPDCESSQRACDFCDAQGAETCIHCGQWVCKTCWPRHADMGGVRECKGGAKRSKKRRPPKPVDRIHARLRAAVEVRETTLFWGQIHTITPRLCSKVFGDGRALLALSAINSRPNYYVIRIDSAWNVEDHGAPKDAPDLCDYLDDIYQALEDDFGSTAYADDEDVIADGRSGDYLDWPVFDGDSGTSWRRMAWPEWKGVMFTVHPFSWHNLLVPASPKRAAQREAKRRRARRKERRGW